MSISSHSRGAAVGRLALVIAVGSALSPTRADVTSEQVRQAVRKGVEAVRRQQNAQGTWPERQYPGGETSLAVLALLAAGERADSRTVRAALPYIRDVPNQHTYVVALKCLALAQADMARFQPQIRDAAQWLVRAQSRTGLWRYTVGASDFDHSNSQFALLGLHAAAGAGVSIGANVWRDALAAVVRTQNKDGGWCYTENAPSYASMTAAGVSDLLILGNRLHTATERGFHDGKALNCGKYRTSKPLADGLQWLARNFSAERNLNGPADRVFYWLYGAERCGILSGQRYFGQHDWYREGAAYLVRSQHPDGSWGSGLVDTCLAILFLAKGHKPLLVQKLAWSNDDAWNPDYHDVEHLVDFIGDKLGEPVAWQIVRMDAPLEEWLAAPLLYFQGHTFPEWNAQQRAKLRAFVEQGGTLLAEACCGASAFRTGFRRFATDAFPEFPLRELGKEHSLYHVHFDCPSYGLLGIDIACRTSVIFSQNDLSCLWEQGDVAKLSERAFELGTNVAAYAMGRRPLRDRLDVVVVPTTAPADARPPSRDALRFGQVVYDGDWRPFPRALVNLAEFLRRELSVDVITQSQPIRLTDPELYACPFLYLAGHFDFRLSEGEQAALVAHLRRGGFLLVDNCCGPEPFDSAFRAFVARAFPGAPLTPLPSDHAIFQGRPGFDVRSVRYGPDVRRAQPQATGPVLSGVELEGRLAVVYSPYALGCGLEGQEFEGCWGLAADDARRVAANIVLYALTH